MTDTQRNEQDYLDYIHCPEAWALVDSVMVDKTPVGVVDIIIDSTHPDYVISNGRGRQLTVQPDRSQTYTLKIQQESNGYVASDTVSVVVKEGRISAITPNPATMSAMISYEVTPNKSASITITDISNTIRQNYPINQANGTQTISVDNMPKGVYYVTLNVEGAVADTKSLIVQ